MIEMFKVYNQCVFCGKIHRNFTQNKDKITCNLCQEYTLEKYFYINRNMIKELLNQEPIKEGA